ncbi:MAG TPA: hypothetical protein VNW47_01465 [Terriglobales bacterium]|jgi:hypothetical protein|nr:hypothetical protein [Terriglobales bacterium]
MVTPGGEQLSIPRAVILVRDRSRIFSLQNFAETFLHGPESLTVAARRHRVPVFAVAFVGFRCYRVTPALIERVRSGTWNPTTASGSNNAVMPVCRDST